MPMGFCAILGGTVTMVGSSPLILLNDLILTSNTALPPEQQMETWSLFSVTPIGIALVATGIIYFVLAGRFVLPATSSESSTTGSNPMAYFHDVYGVDYSLTVSCYAADQAGRACGQCDSCRLRRQGFADAGVDDPTLYRQADIFFGYN